MPIERISLHSLRAVYYRPMRPSIHGKMQHRTFQLAVESHEVDKISADIHCVSEKTSLFLHVGRSSLFFHWLTRQEICNKVHIKYLTTPY